jgi:hypothetical protein
VPSVNIRIHGDNGLLCKVTFWTERDREGFTDEMFSDDAYNMVRDVLLLNTGQANPFGRPGIRKAA